jgi:hypothetical protein
MAERVKMQSGKAVIEVWDYQIEYLVSKGWGVAVDSPEVETVEEESTTNVKDVE